MSSASLAVLSRVREQLGIDACPLLDPEDMPRIPLPSRLASGDLASASTSAVALLAGIHPRDLDGHRVAAAYRSDRLLTIDGTAPPVWSPYSGFWQTADGWIRTHGNYPHHASALRAALHLSEEVGADRLASALSLLDSSTAVDAIASSGGLAVVVAPERKAHDLALRALPLLQARRVDARPAPSRSSQRTAGRRRSRVAPLDGIRVLDLTRVIAGPVATRTLALLGADVLRIDPPTLPEPEWQHIDTGHGKRTALLDARSETMGELVDAADVVVLGYRPAAVERLGLAPDDLIARNPGLIVAQLSAWGPAHPDLAGFDSLVQAASGIAMIESPDGTRPGALPAQVLDHSAGYLLAAAITALVHRRHEEGGAWTVETSLRRIAAELLGMPRRPEAGPLPDAVRSDPALHTARFRVAGHEVTTARPVLPGRELSAPHPWGSDQPRW